MILNAKDHLRRCPHCGMVVGYETDSFCHSCGEFFDDIGGRWLDKTNDWLDQSLFSLDIKEEGRIDEND